MNKKKYFIYWIDWFTVHGMSWPLNEIWYDYVLYRKVKFIIILQGSLRWNIWGRSFFMKPTMKRIYKLSVIIVDDDIYNKIEYRWSPQMICTSLTQLTFTSFIHHLREHDEVEQTIFTGNNVCICISI